MRGLFERRHALAVLGAVHLGVCLLFVMLVNLLHWSPSDAQMPSTILGALHVTGSGFATAWLLLMRGSYRRMVARI